MKKTISFAENANEVENNRLQAQEEAVPTTTTENTPEEVDGLTIAEFEALQNYINRKKLNLLIPDNLGEIIDNICYVRQTEFLHLLPSAIEALTKAGQSEFIASLRPIMNCLVTIIDYNHILTDLSVFAWDIDKAVGQAIKRAYPRVMQ